RARIGARRMEAPPWRGMGGESSGAARMPCGSRSRDAGPFHGPATPTGSAGAVPRRACELRDAEHTRGYRCPADAEGRRAIREVKLVPFRSRSRTGEKDLGPPPQTPGRAPPGPPPRLETRPL